MKFINFAHFISCVLAFVIPTVSSIYLVKLFELNDSAKVFIVLTSMMIGAVLMMLTFIYWVMRDQRRPKGKL